MRRLLALLTALLLAACTPQETPPIADYRTLGELRVATQRDAISYFENADGATAGFEHDLVERLGQTLEVPVRFILYADATRAIDAVIQGQVHMAAAGLARRDRLPLLWSAPLREVDYVLVGRSDSPDVLQEADLAGRTVSVRHGSPAAQRLEEITTQTPEMQLQYPQAFNDQKVLERLSRGELDLVATDRTHFALAAQIDPDLAIKYDLPLKTSLAWALPLRATGDLPERVKAFLSDAATKGLIERTADRYFSHTRRISAADAAVFLDRIESRLSEFRPHFEAAEAETGIDWRYIAALAYQESHWDPLARSPTGVRGMMMLTGETADRLGVKDRLDARQSIAGGARYLERLRESLPEEIAEPDRTWLATAAYNLGMGHLNGARTIARQLKKDDASWWDMKTVLPLLSKPQYSARLKSGPARGGEAVVMTENIRNYYSILLRVAPAFQAPAARPGMQLRRSNE